MICIHHRAGLVLIASLVTMPMTLAQSIDTPQTRMRPIGSPSMADQYRIPNQRADYRQSSDRRDQADRTSNGSQIRRAAWMQNFGMPPQNNGVPPQIDNGMSFPQPFSPPPVQIPSPITPRSLPTGPIANQPMMDSTNLPPPSLPPLGVTGTRTPAPINSIPNTDYAPLTQPQLSNQFATLDNSCHVSAPSRYTAASASGCTGPGCTAPVNYQAPPAYIAPPAVIAPGPGVPAPIILPAAAGAPAGVPVSVTQELNLVQVGPGLFGRPVAYVPGQKFRNYMRYLFH
jgi:hypothetical protein